MKHDLYPILIDELMSLYNLTDVKNNTNTLYKHLYIKCSIVNERKNIKKHEVMNFILNELNISTFDTDENNNKTGNYVIYKNEIYMNYIWYSEFMDNFKFRAELEDDLDFDELLEEVYLKGYRKALKYKNAIEYRDYIKYYRLTMLNTIMNVKSSYSAGVEGFTECCNHNPFKRSIEESLEMKLQSAKLLKSHTTTHISEADLENFLVKNINLIEDGMTYFDRQVEIDGGITDIIARDKNNVLCIIEIKIKEDKNIIWQALYYPDEIMKKYRTDKVRMITLTPEYSAHIKKALLSLDNIELMDYQIKVEKGQIIDFKSRLVNN